MGLSAVAKETRNLEKFMTSQSRHFQKILHRNSFMMFTSLIIFGERAITDKVATVISKTSHNNFCCRQFSVSKFHFAVLSEYYYAVTSTLDVTPRWTLQISQGSKGVRYFYNF